MPKLAALGYHVTREWPYESICLFKGLFKVGLLKGELYRGLYKGIL